MNTEEFIERAKKKFMEINMTIPNQFMRIQKKKFVLSAFHMVNFGKNLIII